MDRVHGFSSWVYGIVDQSRPLILIQAARILLRKIGIGDAILALHLWAGGSRWTGRQGWCTGPARWCHRGLAGAPLLSSPGHDDVGFSGPNDAGVDMVLTWGKTRHGTASRQLAATTLVLRISSVVHGHSKAAPTSRSSPTSSLWPPLASRLVQWLQSVRNSLNFGGGLGSAGFELCGLKSELWGALFIGGFR
jgi:hypothetical protein